MHIKESSLKDRIIIVMGPTGSGKSTFVDIATQTVDGSTVGHGMVSHTSAIREIRVNHPTTGDPVILVDTPGFNDTNKSDADILEQITEWISKTYKGKLIFATIIFLHRITDNRISVMPDVVLATTMWSDTNPETGIKREFELKHIWADMLAQQCRVERFEDTYQSAWFIIGHRRKILDGTTAKENDETEPKGTEMRQTKQSLYIENPRNISTKDRIVVVMSPTGAGKSNMWKS
ncbi:hypothetical protein PILCRDRAFT_748336 [Piloderma croceum F 1598]|uniref:G domain-containing protein n=1 Tax=Piloderma croceum (strain F 1598) TaxID=765440 RepID=A0A0C3ADI4_PILCF|nr:hypothetical protein PILCRDRAFT_748336 [Piloderma croceum F 1598]